MTTSHIKTREEPTPESSGRPVYLGQCSMWRGVLFGCYDSEENPGCQAHFYVTGRLDTRPTPVACVEVQVKVRYDTVVWSAKRGHGISRLPKTKVGWAELNGVHEKGNYKYRLPYDTPNQLQRGHEAKRMYIRGGFCGVSQCKLQVSKMLMCGAGVQGEMWIL